MLVLSRKIGEKIQILNNITISVEDIRGGKVRIGITAPDEVPIYREEVWERMKGENGKEETGKDGSEGAA